MLTAKAIARDIGKNWPLILEQLGIARVYLQNRHGPCPACGGADRYRFDNKFGTGGFYCNGCGAGDGFALLQRVHGWDFRTARQQVMKAAGYRDREDDLPVPRKLPPAPPAAPEVAQPSRRVLHLRRETCGLIDLVDAENYLGSRRVWRRAIASSLRGHSSVDYFADGKSVGRYPALVADVRDIDDALVTLHVTYLQSGAKLATHEPRKILSPLTGREGCAVRLQAIDGDTLGVAEGIETALASAELHGVPVWAALNAGLLAKFTPPASVKRLVIFADRDVAGLTAAGRLMERLQGRVALEMRLPPGDAKDWADALEARS